ncbi:MAG: hypothetical protein KME38_23955 [Spirirestis rafaelensis WJT71-NPBG6]|jgi:WD40 repeat protein/energy-coupling factor transporter ATP-binding protein EcfA2|nr:hypothetical protein [Spirirestis rafaelensis WJT71-NPBG6]
MVPEPLGTQQQAQTFGDISMRDGNILTITQTIHISIAAVQTRPLITTSPYKGLKKFNSKDKDYFFGRNQLIASLIEAVKNTNLILLLGASGSGKSSIIRAGLIPQISELLGAKFCDFTLTPDRDPFESLRISLVSQGYKQEQVEIALKGESNTLTQVIQSLKVDNSQWLIFIDQFEELFTICQNLEKRKNFLENIVKIANYQDNSVKIVIAMRADFLDKFSPYPSFGQIAQKNIHLITDMHSDEFRLAIEQPAARNGVVFEPGLVEEIIKDVQGQAGSLPLLQYTLNLLWQTDNITDRTLTKKTYRELGGVRGALQEHVDEIYNNLTEQEKAETKKIFLRLVDIVGSFDKAHLVNSSVSRRAYLSDFPDDSLLRSTLQKLIDNNLIISNREQQTTVKEKATVEIAHEILITSWQTLKNWIEESKEVIIIRNRLADDAQRWNNLLIANKTKAEDELWAGSKLDRVLELQEEKLFELVLGGLNEEQDRFIIESVALRERLRKQEEERIKQEKARKRGLILLLGVLSISVLSAISVGIWARFQRETNKSLQLANASESNLNIDTTRSLWLAIAAKLTQDTPQADLALWNALQANHERYQLLGHNKEVLYAEFAPGDSKRVLTVSGDRTARIWDLNNLAHPLVLKGHEDIIQHGSFDPQNPKRILTVSNDRTARIWNLDNFNNPIILKGHEAPINYGSFDPKNSNRVLTVSSDGTARVWDINNPNNPLILKGHERDVWMGSFDPQNSNRVLTVGSDSTARIWNLSQPDKPLILKGHKSQVIYGSFDPKNSNRVLTVSSDRTARIWNLNNPTQPIVLQGHSETVNYGSFDLQDPNRVLTVSNDNTARIWNLKNPVQSQILKGHQGKIFHGEFNPEDSNQILTVSEDGTARIWDLKNSTNPTTLFTLRGHTQGISFGTFDPKDPSIILTVSNDSTARIWNVRDVTSKQIVSSNTNIINSIFAPDNLNRVLSISSQGSVEEWNLNNLKDSKILPIQIKSIQQAWFAPSDPNQIATISSRGKFHIWNLQKPDKSLELPKGEKEIFELRFDPKNATRILRINSNSTATVLDISNNTNKKSITLPALRPISEGAFDPNDPDRVATTSVDGTVYIWSLREVIKTSKPLYQFSASQQQIWHLSFDPNNSNRILTMGGDRVARIWDLGSRSIITELSGHQDTVVDGSFDPNNPNRVLTVSYDGTARVWDLRIPNNPLILTSHNGKLISGSFDSHNRVLTVGNDGKVNIYYLGKKELLQISLNNFSRCLSSQEEKNYNLTNLELRKLLSSYSHKSTQLLFQQKYLPNCLQQLPNKTDEKETYSAANF